MFDGFKISIVDQLTTNRLHRNCRLEFVEHTNTITGEVESHTTEYKSLKIKTFPSGRIKIKGSLHKYYNDGLHNWNDFTVSKLKEVLDSLQSELNIDPLKASINNLEFGVNIVTSFCPNALLNTLLCFKWKPFNVMDIIGPGMGKECKSYDQYFVKIYNKGLQFGQSDNILRVEKKITTMVALKFGKLNLSDLLNPELWKHCKMELVNMVNDILINEPIDINALTKNEQRIYNTLVNQSNWINFNRDQRKRYKKAFNDIIFNYGKGQYKPTILKLINEKFEQLVNT